MEGNNSKNARRQREPGLSYKFQRLREELRQAIAAGELKGKLPGERSLAQRFRVNAKTLSKALTDLAAEGLLDRSVGRGTYVKGSAPKPVEQRRWLLISDPEARTSPLVNHLRTAHPEMEVITDISSVRPSFLNQFSAVIDCSTSTPDKLLRDLVVRNIPVVIVGKEPQTFSTHAVLLDRHLAVARMGRNLLADGHRHLVVVDNTTQTSVATLKVLVERHAPDAQIDECIPAELASYIERGATGVICATELAAHEAVQTLKRLNVNVPGKVAILATGTIESEAPCSGYYVDVSQKADAILHVLREGAVHRPVMLWLAGRFIDRGTSAPVRDERDWQSGDAPVVN